MKHMRRPTSVGYIAGAVLVLSVCNASESAAVPVSFRAYATTAWTDNLFQSQSERGETIQQLAFDVDLTRAGLAGYYTGRVDLYGEYEDLFTQTHTAGLVSSRGVGRRQRLTGDLQVTWRASGAAYDYRDYLEARGTLGLRRFLRPTLMVKGRAGLASRNYRHAGDFSYVEPTAWAEVSRFLSSGTTLVAGTRAGIKAYLRDSTADSTSVWSRSASSGSQVLASVWLKVAQSLGRNSGLQLQYWRQSLWTGQSRYRQPDDYAPVDELFDDDYGYSGPAWRVTLKHLRDRFEGVLIAGRAKRHYEGRPALDLDGLPLGETRADRRANLRLRMSRHIFTPVPATDAILRFEASAISVASNDLFYDTAMRLLSLTLEVGF